MLPEGFTDETLVQGRIGIEKDGKKLYRQSPQLGGEKAWLVEQLAADGATRISTKPDRSVSDILNPFGPRLPLGKDVTGQGAPNLIIGSYGSH